LKELTTNGQTVTSIWKTDKSKANTENHNQARHRQAYRDPTAKAAIDNILNEERKANRKKQQANKQNRRS